MKRQVGSLLISSGWLIASTLVFLTSCAKHSRPSDALFTAPRMAAKRFAKVVSESERRSEVEEKIKRVRNFIRQRPLDGVLLTRSEHVSWIMGGIESIGTASERS